MKTIIQTIGPLYGEDVNGTVFGQPNGSQAIPAANALIVEDNRSNAPYLVNGSGAAIYSVNASKQNVTALSFKAFAQVPFKIRVEISATSDFASVLTSYVSATLWPAGGTYWGTYIWGKNSDLTIVDGTSYYIRGVLVTAGGDTMAVTDGYKMTGKVFA